MRKKLLTILLAVVLCIISGVPAFALSDQPRLVDGANLLSESEKTEVLAQLDEISERQQVDIVVVTVKSMDGKTTVQYADDFYDYHNYGFGDQKDGVLLLINMEGRDWYISTAGYGIQALTDVGIRYIGQSLLEDLGEGNYARAFTSFANECDDFITQARTGQPYDNGNLPQGGNTGYVTKGPFNGAKQLGISLGIGLVLALIITGVMASSLKSVHKQPGADTYMKSGSMNVTESKDLFLYKHLDRRERPKNTSSSGSSTHSSSSGRSHGGGGGKF